MLKDYKKLMIPPILLFLFSAGVLLMNYSETGEFLDKGIDFNGGTEISIYTEGAVDIKTFETAFHEQIDVNGMVRTIKSNAGQTIVIETENELELGEIEKLLEQQGISYKEDGINRVLVGATLGEGFFREAQIAVLIAFVLMSLVTFFTFRTFVPSVAIISAAVSDILFAMAMMSVLEIELSLATVAALLMLFGYSVDTDILLSTRVLKRKEEGTLDERINSSVKTGVTMTATSIAAFTTLYLISTSRVLDQIALVLILGLLADLITTWFQNVGILRWFIEKEHKKTR